MTISNRPPLWRVMRQAYDQAPPAPPGAADDWTDRHGYAAEIRALRDWLVPEEEGDPPIVGYKPTRDAVAIHAMWRQRQYLRALLSTEANRAERGNG